MLSSNLRLTPKQAAKAIDFDGENLTLAKKPLQFDLLIAKPLIPVGQLIILLNGELGDRLYEWVTKVSKVLVGWFGPNASPKICRDHPHVYDSLLHGQPRPNLNSMLGYLVWELEGSCSKYEGSPFVATSAFNWRSCQWKVKSIRGAKENVNMLARGLDRQGWHLPSHWYARLYKLIR